MQEELFAYISELYNLPNVSLRSGEVSTGTLSVNQEVISDSNKFFLKQYKDTFTEDRVKEVHRAKKFFSDGGIPVILPLQNKSGTTYFTFGGFLYALFPFFNEMHLDRQDMSPKAIESMASLLARIHLRGKSPDFKMSATFKPWDKEKGIEKAEKIIKAIEAKKTRDDFDKLALDNVVLKIWLMKDTDKKFSDFNVGIPHLIHGDYHDHNLFFNDQEQVTHVFDFEKTDMSPRTYELIRSMHFTTLDGDINEEKLGKAQNYLKAYHAVYPITKEEFEQGMEVYYMKLIHSLWVVEEYYLNNSYRSSIFLKKDCEALIYFKDHYQELIKNLEQVL